MLERVTVIKIGQFIQRLRQKLGIICDSDDALKIRGRREWSVDDLYTTEIQLGSSTAPCLS